MKLAWGSAVRRWWKFVGWDGMVRKEFEAIEQLVLTLVLNYVTFILF